MNQEQQRFFNKVHEVTEFCLEHIGRCFTGKSREELFIYIGEMALQRGIFVIRKQGEIKAVAFAQPTSEGRVLVKEVIGNRTYARDLYEAVMRQIPDAKRFFTYRWKRNRHVLVELASLRRFCLGKEGAK